MNRDLNNCIKDLLTFPQVDLCLLQKYYKTDNVDIIARKILQEHITKKRSELPPGIIRNMRGFSEDAIKNRLGVDTLVGADLNGADMRDVILNNANLHNTRLMGANLENALLIEAHLDGALLFDANLAGAMLIGADLGYANLTGARLIGANLRDADLTGTIGANLNRAIFEEPILNPERNMRGFTEFQIKEHLGLYTLVGADLEASNLRHANLAGAFLNHAILSDSYLDDAILSGAHLEYATFYGTHMDNVNLTNAHLNGAMISESSGVNVKLNGADLRDANLTEAHFQDSDFRGADLRGANLTGAVINNSDLRGANLTGVIISGTSFEGSNLTGAIFDHASRDANLTNVILEDSEKRTRVRQELEARQNNPRPSEPEIILNENRKDCNNIKDPVTLEHVNDIPDQDLIKIHVINDKEELERVNCLDKTALVGLVQNAKQWTFNNVELVHLTIGDVVYYVIKDDILKILNNESMTGKIILMPIGLKSIVKKDGTIRKEAIVYKIVMK